MIARFFLTLTGFLAAQVLFSQSINTEKSEAKFSLSNIGFNTVKGSLTGMEGTILFSPNQLDNSSFHVCVQVNTIQTGIGKRDSHLKGEDFFHSEKYPSICFESNSVTKTESGFETIGELTMRGVSNIVSIPFTYSENTFTGTFIISRLAYKVGEDTSTFTAGDEIEIEIICVTE